MPLKDYVVLPLADFLVNKAHPIDIEQKQKLELVLVGNEIFIVAFVFMHLKFLPLALILMNLLAFGSLKIFLFLFPLQELLLLVEVLPPPVEVVIVVTFLLPKCTGQILRIF